MKLPKYLLYPLAFLALGIGVVRAGQMSLQTYYPAPTGYYNNLYSNNVGIGTNVPLSGARLQVVGTVPTGYAAFNDGGCGTDYFGFGLNGSVPTGCANYNLLSSPTYPDLFINRPAGAEIEFREGGGVPDQMDIMPGGNVGIGTTSPFSQLQVGKDLSFQSSWPTIGFNVSAASGDYLTTNYGGWIQENYTTGALNINSFSSGTAGTGLTVGSYITLYGSGNVGIGSTAPAAPLDVGGYIHTSGDVSPTTTTQGAYLNWNALTHGTGETDFINNEGEGTGGFAWMNTPSTGFPQTPIMFLSGTGNLGIDTTNTNATLYVNGDEAVGNPSANLQITSNQIFTDPVASTPNLYLQSSDPSANVVIGGAVGATNSLYVYGTIYLETVTAGPVLSEMISISNSGSIVASGDITANGNFVSLSDGRLKANIIPLTNTLAKLDQLNGVSFQWNHLSTTMGHKDGEASIGVIAQELQKVYPELVSHIKNGHKDYLAIDYSKFTAVLLQAVKELKSQNDTMQDQIDALQDKVKALEKQQ